MRHKARYNFNAAIGHFRAFFPIMGAVLGEARVKIVGGKMTYCAFTPPKIAEKNPPIPPLQKGGKGGFGDCFVKKNPPKILRNFLR